MRSLNVAKARTKYCKEPDYKGHRNQRACRTCNRLLGCCRIFSAEHATINIGARRVRGAVSENQQKQIEGREVCVKGERRCCRNSFAQGIRTGSTVECASKQRKARQQQEPHNNQAGLHKVGAQNRKLPTRKRVACKHRRRHNRSSRIAHGSKSHQELGSCNNLGRHNARPRHGNHNSCHQARALAVQVLDQIGQRIFTMLVSTACKRYERQEPKRPHQHKPACGPAESSAAIDGANHGRPAKNRRHEATGYRLRRRTLARHEEIGNVFYAPRTA